MNENDVSDLLHRATRDLAPDVGSLVAGGIRRGQVRQRRRRTAAAVTTSAAVVLVAAAGFQLLTAEDTASRGISPVDPAPPSASARSAHPAPVARAELAVTTTQVPAAFASLAPGRVSRASSKSGPDAAPVVDFTWDGFGIRVGLTPDDYVTGRSVPDPARRCAEQAQGDPCRPGPGGTVVSTSSTTNPAADGGTHVRSVSVFRPDGWDVLVMAYNGPGKEGPVLASEPPFDRRQLLRIASSDVWFR